MNFKVEYTEAAQPVSSRPTMSGRSCEISRISVSHSSAEMNIIAGDTVITLPPSAAKRLLRDLRAAVGEYDAEQGKIALPVTSSRKEPAVNRVIKALYKTRKLGPKLMSINTRKRKHLPLDSGEKEQR